MEAVAGDNKQYRAAERARNVAAIRARWVHGVEGPLEESYSRYESAEMYQVRRSVGEKRQLLAEYALALPINTVPHLKDGEA